MNFIHTKCGGSINTKTRTCGECHKHWGLLSWWLDPTEIRSIPDHRTKSERTVRVKPARSQYSKWADKIPGVATVASRLPKWPRWARILLTVGVVAAGILLVMMIRC